MKKILILGASRYYINQIIDAKTNGFFTIVVDRNKDSEGFKYADKCFVCDIVDIEQVQKIALEEKVDAIIPLNDYGVLTASIVSEKLGLFNIPVDVAKRSTSKNLMRKKWIEDGVNSPKLGLGKTDKEIKDIAIKIGFPVILKPAEGLGGASRGVIVVNNEEELNDAIEFSHQYYEDKSTLVEEFIIAKSEHSIEALVRNGKVHIVAIGDNEKLPLPYRVNKSITYPTSIDTDSKTRLMDEVIKAVLSIGITNGVAHIEAAVTNKGIYLFELGARCGGGGIPNPLVKFHSGVNEFIEFVKILTQEPAGNLEPQFFHPCIYHFFTPAPGKILKVNKLEMNEDFLDAAFFYQNGDTINEVKVGTDRAGFVILKGNSINALKKQAREIESSLNIEYEK